MEPAGTIRDQEKRTGRTGPDLNDRRPVSRRQEATGTANRDPARFAFARAKDPAPSVISGNRTGCSLRTGRLRQ